MRFEIYDTRTDKVIGVNTYLTAEYAQTVIDRVFDHQSRGDRMDLEGVRFWSVRPMSDPYDKV
jgi:hypothetical protein